MEGMFAVVENKARDKQREGFHIVIFIILSRVLTTSPLISKSQKIYSEAFTDETGFIIGVLATMRPTALATFTATQFRKEQIRDDLFWVISGSDRGPFVA